MLLFSLTQTCTEVKLINNSGLVLSVHKNLFYFGVHCPNEGCQVHIHNMHSDVCPTHTILSAIRVRAYSHQAKAKNQRINNKYQRKNLLSLPLSLGVNDHKHGNGKKWDQHSVL